MTRDQEIAKYLRATIEDAKWDIDLMLLSYQPGENANNSPAVQLVASSFMRGYQRATEQAEKLAGLVWNSDEHRYED